MNNSGLFRGEVFEQKLGPKGQYALFVPISWKMVNLGLVVAFCLSIIIAAVTPYTRTEVVEGVLIFDPGSSRITAQREGTISRILFDNGDEVDAGDTLIIVDTDTQLADEAAFDQRASILEQQIASLNYQSELGTELLRADIAANTQRQRGAMQELRSVESQIENQQNRLARSQSDLAKAESIYSRGFLQRSELIERENEVSSVEAALMQLQGRAERLRAEVRELNIRKDQLRLQSTQDSSSIQERIESLHITGAALQAQSSLIIKSPISGVVTSSTKSQGQSVSAQEDLMTVVPSQRRLIARLYVNSSSRMHVGLGSAVSMRVQARDGWIGSPLEGKIVELSQSTQLVEVGGRTTEAFVADVEIDDASQLVDTNSNSPEGYRVTGYVGTETRTILGWISSVFEIN